MPYGGFNAKGFALGSFGHFGFASFGRLALASFGQIAGRGIRARARVRLQATRGRRCRAGARRLLGLSQLASFCQMPSSVPGTLDAACIVERSDGALALRPRTPLVAIDRREPRDRSGREQRRRRRVKAVPAGGGHGVSSRAPARRHKDRIGLEGRLLGPWSFAPL
jgi:hypothetical protein